MYMYVYSWSQNNDCGLFDDRSFAAIAITVSRKQLPATCGYRSFGLHSTSLEHQHVDIHSCQHWIASTSYNPLWPYQEQYSSRDALDSKPHGSQQSHRRKPRDITNPRNTVILRVNTWNFSRSVIINSGFKYCTVSTCICKLSFSHVKHMKAILSTLCFSCTDITVEMSTSVSHFPTQASHLFVLTSTNRSWTKNCDQQSDARVKNDA